MVAPANRLWTPRHWKKTTSGWCCDSVSPSTCETAQFEKCFFSGVRNLLATSAQGSILKCGRPSVLSACGAAGSACPASQSSAGHWALGQQWLTCDLKTVQAWLLSWDCAGLHTESYVQVRYRGHDSSGDAAFPHLVPFWEGLASYASMGSSARLFPAEHADFGKSFLEKHNWLYRCLCWDWMYYPAWVVLKTRMNWWKLKSTWALQYLSLRKMWTGK